MASSSNRKSNSSVSKASKPTFRRAGSKASAPRPQAAPAPVPRQAKKPISSYTARTRVGKPVMRKRASAPAAKPLKQKPAAQKPIGSKLSTPAVAALKKPQRRMKPLTTVAAPAKPAPAGKAASLLGRIGAVFAGIAHAIGSFASGKVIAIVVACALVLGVGGVVLVNSPVFAATDVVIEGSEHVSTEAAQRLVTIPSGTTLFNVNADAITEALSENPWVTGVSIEREFPHTLRIKPEERTVAAIVYIPADDIAWAIGSDGNWIAPVSLSVSTDAEGNVVEGTVEGGQTLTGADAAHALARKDGAILFTDVPTDVEPSTGREVSSEVVLAGLAYANGFSPEFIAQIQSLSLPSVDAITAYLDSGIEVSLGAPDDIETKERVVTRLLEQQQGVTYINVRVPDNYTFRSAPTD
ncbi:hypothetical protein B5F89_01190 [Collinsella sp. An307]|nr:hypothetical protein B5F89_01190 [Collinsella sp. An307]